MGLETTEQHEIYLQPFQRRLNIRELEENGSIRDFLIVEHEADAPDNRREADILDAGQVVQNNFVIRITGHIGIHLRRDMYYSTSKALL